MPLLLWLRGSTYCSPFLFFSDLSPSTGESETTVSLESPPPTLALCFALELMMNEIRNPFPFTSPSLWSFCFPAPTARAASAICVHFSLPLTYDGHPLFPLQFSRMTQKRFFPTRFYFSRLTPFHVASSG